MKRLQLLLLMCASFNAYAARTSADVRQAVLLPEKFVLAGGQAEQRLVLVAWQEQEFCGNWPIPPTFTSSDSGVVQVDGVWARPVANGRAVITAVAGDVQAQAEVEVVDMERPLAASFRHDVLAVFAKAGCNMGACHGALAGKGGFKLSLRGYDPQNDYFRIVLEARGRRVEPLDPARSLILAKPTGAIPHKGGVRFGVDSRDYELVANWIASGAAPPDSGEPYLERLEILPSRALLSPGSRQQFLVTAYYSDGRQRDVTRWAKYESTHAAVARVNESGEMETVGPGEGAITAWFDSQIAVAHISSPYGHPIDASLLHDERRLGNFIDQLVLDQLQRLGLNPSPLADDATFLRRAYIDAIGTLPSVQEVEDFLADERPNKREALIDSLFQRNEFVDYWAYKWSDLLLVNGQLLRPRAVQAYYRWIREQVARNTPWDEFARQILTAQGSSLENGAVNFYALHQDPESLTENICQAFLGLSLGCAKCHNHPLEKWTNDQYYAMANLFARVRSKGWGGDPRTGDGERTVYVSASGDLLQPSIGKPQRPAPLDADPLPLDWPGDRRVPLADWLTSPDNPYFARAIVNRVWANFMGVGLIEAVDDVRESNPPSNQRLMDALTLFLIERDFDLQDLMKEIMRSRTYQRSSQPLAGNVEDQRFYSRYFPRRLQAEVLLDAISQVTDVPSAFTEIEFPSSDKYATDFYPQGTRAIQLYDSAVQSWFLTSFGRNSRTITCECERSDDPSIVQVLHLTNGDTVNRKLSVAGNRIDHLMTSGLTDAQLIDHLFLLTLARKPTVDEASEAGTMFAETPAVEKRSMLEDLLWGLLNSREFLFNH